VQSEWRNLYKRSDVFFCPHRLHKHRESGTSTWHIIRHKQCFPQGCKTFRWRCRKFEAGRKCHRGKKHVGKDCFSCPYFFDIKEVYQPETKLPENEYRNFLREFEEFEDWVTELTRRRIEVRAVVKAINPLLVDHGGNGIPKIAGRGVLLYFGEGIFEYDKFLDPFYARLSFSVYDRYRIAVGDEIDFKGELRIDRGRFVIDRVGGIETIRASGGEIADLKELRQARFTGTVIEGQPAKCLRCPNGLLIDSLNSDGRSQPRRLMYCTKGVADYRYCPYNI
jgi:hypothetical protein